MPSTLYEYAILRLVPRVEREEFLNIGVILYGHADRQLTFRYHISNEALCALAPDFDPEWVTPYLVAMSNHCQGQGPLGDLSTVSRFRWLTATKSTLLQFSKVHPGYADQPALEVDRLMRLYVQR